MTPTQPAEQYNYSKVARVVTWSFAVIGAAIGAFGAATGIGMPFADQPQNAAQQNPQLFSFIVSVLWAISVGYIWGWCVSRAFAPTAFLSDDKNCGSIGTKSVREARLLFSVMAILFSFWFLGWGLESLGWILPRER